MSDEDILRSLRIDEIDGVSAFLDEPAQLATVPATQRVRDFLASVCGALWASAGVLTYTHTLGTAVYVAFTPPLDRTPDKRAMLLVAERADGGLALLPLLPPEEGDQIAQSFFESAENGGSCLQRITQAFCEIRALIDASEMSSSSNFDLLDELRHATTHLR